MPPKLEEMRGQILAISIEKAALQDKLEMESLAKEQDSSCLVEKQLELENNERTNEQVNSECHSDPSVESTGDGPLNFLEIDPNLLSVKQEPKNSIVLDLCLHLKTLSGDAGEGCGLCNGR